MAQYRLSALNIVLLLVSLFSLGFGVWGMLQADPARHELRNNQRGADERADVARDDNAGSRESTRDRPSRAPANHRNGDTPTADVVHSDTPSRDTRTPEYSNPSDRGDGVLNGAVRFPDGKPVAGVMVSLVRTDLDIPYPHGEVNTLDPEDNRRAQDEYHREITRQTRLATSSAEGRFSFSGLDEARSYNLSAGSREHGYNSAYNVTPGEEVNIWLLPHVILRGTVKREDGTSVDRFYVDVRTKQNQDWNSIGGEQFNAAKGEFRTGAQAGKCRVVVTSKGLAMKGEPEVELTEAGGQVDIVMGPAATLTGTLTGKDGSPLRNANVRLNGVTKEDELSNESKWGRGFGGLRFSGFGGEYWGNDEGEHQATTDNRGRYRIESVIPGDYSIIASYGVANETRKAALKPGPNQQDFSLEAGCTVTVKVNDPKGTPVVSAWVNFTTADGNGLNYVQMRQQKPGEFIYGGLVAGKCTMQVGMQGFPGLKKEIELKAGENRFEVAFIDGAYLEGRVTTNSGAVVREHYVRIGKPGKVNDNEWEDGMYAQTDAKGKFRLGPVEPGEYEMVLGANSGQKLSSMNLRLAAGENKQDMVVESLCSLKVTVKKGGGEPAQQCNVNLSFTQGESNDDSRSTDARGECEFHFLKEGDWNLTAYSQEGVQVTQTVHIRRGANEVMIEMRPPDCVKVTWMEPEGEGTKAGLKTGDLITAYNGTATPTLQKLAELVKTTDASATVSISIIRDGSAMAITAKGGLLGISGDNHAR